MMPRASQISVNPTGLVTATDVQAAIEQLASAVAARPGELLMQDGVTNPPVPVENETSTDWLYEG